MDANQLKTIMPYSSQGNRAKFLPELNKLMPEFGINTPLREAHFIAQLAHESGSLNYVKELASGSAYDTGSLALRLGNTPAADGDGQRYKGRGLIQLTGLSNYKQFQAYLGGAPDIISRPELLEQPHLATMVSCWFWSTRGLNTLADKDDLLAITKKINGGTNGLADRKQFLERAKKELL